MNLYEIDGELIALLENGFNMSCIDTETGEIDEGKVQQYLTLLPIERDKKLEGYGMVIKNYQAEIAAIKAEEANLAERRKAKEKRVEMLKKAVVASLEMFNQAKFETAKVVFGFRKSTEVQVPDISVLDRRYIKEEVEYSANKTAIKEAIKQGLKIEGAELVEKKNLQIK